MELLQPDAFSAISFPLGEALEGIDYRPMKWPGHGADPNVTFQYLDQELISAAEYDEYLPDPTCFTAEVPAAARRRLRGAAVAAGFRDAVGMAPDRRGGAFANPELRDSLQRLFEVGEKRRARARKTRRSCGDDRRRLSARGGSFCKAPFDLFVDFLRGSKGAMLDMFRHKDKLLAAIDNARQPADPRRVDEANRRGAATSSFRCTGASTASCRRSSSRRFYWPRLRKIMLHLIEKDLVPCVFWEGNCSSRLELIADVPRGKAIYWFEATTCSAPRKCWATSSACAATCRPRC